MTTSTPKEGGKAKSTKHTNTQTQNKQKQINTTKKQIKK
jgi:hypothetical protein